MVISAQDKAILLERLQRARETKAAKAAAKKKETPASVKEPEPPAPVAVPPPAPVPEPPAPAPEPVPPVVPDVPDLVAMSRKKPAKKKKVESSDDDSDEEEAELPPKKGKSKSQKPKYMKIVVYREPKNPNAFQSLVEAIQDEQPEPEPEPVYFASPPASDSIGRGCKFDIKNKTKPEGRSLPTPQELMRRAALEFFS
jgi:hypothetical protein